MSNSNLTERELRAAYKRAGLWRIGMTYERAINVPGIRIALTCSINAARRKTALAGQRTPSQLGLI